MNRDQIFAGTGSMGDVPPTAGVFRQPSQKDFHGEELPSYHAELIMARLDELLIYTKTYLTVEESAKYLSLTVNSVRRLLYDGSLPYCRPSKRVYIAKKDLDDYIAKNRYDSESETASKASDYIVGNH